MSVDPTRCVKRLASPAEIVLVLSPLVYGVVRADSPLAGCGLGLALPRLCSVFSRLTASQAVRQDCREMEPDDDFNIAGWVGPLIPERAKRELKSKQRQRRQLRAQGIRTHFEIFPLGSDHLSDAFDRRFE